MTSFAEPFKISLLSAGLLLPGLLPASPSVSVESFPASQANQAITIPVTPALFSLQDDSRFIPEPMPGYTFLTLPDNGSLFAAQDIPLNEITDELDYASITSASESRTDIEELDPNDAELAPIPEPSIIFFLGLLGVGAVLFRLFCFPRGPYNSANDI